MKVQRASQGNDQCKVSVSMWGEIFRGHIEVYEVNEVNDWLTGNPRLG